MTFSGKAFQNQPSTVLVEPEPSTVLVEPEALVRLEAAAEDSRNSSEQAKRVEQDHTESLGDNCGSLTGTQEFSG